QWVVDDQTYVFGFSLGLSGVLLQTWKSSRTTTEYFQQLEIHYRTERELEVIESRKTIDLAETDHMKEDENAGYESEESYLDTDASSLKASCYSRGEERGVMLLSEGAMLFSYQGMRSYASSLITIIEIPEERSVMLLL
ncbi:5645_t:CDS:2, partial [Acaulospora colombiana]